MIFSAFLSSYVLELFLPFLFKLSLFYPYFQGAQAISVWSPPDDSLLLFYLSASHSEFHHEVSFHTSFSFLLPTFVLCQPSSSLNIQIHSSSITLFTQPLHYTTQPFSFNVRTLSHCTRYLTKFSPASTYSSRHLTLNIMIF